LEYSLQPSSCPDCEAIGAHLADCEACREVLKQEQELVVRLNALGPMKPATDMWSVVREKTRGSLPIWARFTYGVMWTGARRLAAAGTAVCVLVALVAGVSHYSTKRQETAVSYLMQMQMPAQAQTVAWTDDPLGDPNGPAPELMGEGS
jgi:hypothetical protein